MSTDKGIIPGRIKMNSTVKLDGSEGGCSFVVEVEVKGTNPPMVVPVTVYAEEVLDPTLEGKRVYAECVDRGGKKHLIELEVEEVNMDEETKMYTISLYKRGIESGAKFEMARGAAGEEGDVEQFAKFVKRASDIIGVTPLFNAEDTIIPEEEK